jgi:hypothetical protein
MLFVVFLAHLAALRAFTHAQEHGEDAAKSMGPVAFMWPPDREWGAAQDNRSPCGSSSGVRNRTDFPLVNGQVALVMQEEAWHVQVSIAHTDGESRVADSDRLVG